VSFHLGKRHPEYLSKESSFLSCICGLSLNDGTENDGMDEIGSFGAQ
jgi:hypothetical protein